MIKESTVHPALASRGFASQVFLVIVAFVACRPSQQAPHREFKWGETENVFPTQLPCFKHEKGLFKMAFIWGGKHNVYGKRGIIYTRDASGARACVPASPPSSSFSSTHSTPANSHGLTVRLSVLGINSRFGLQISRSIRKS